MADTYFFSVRDQNLPVILRKDNQKYTNEYTRKYTKSDTLQVLRVHTNNHTT